MVERRVLIVDDEKNIRLTLTQALAALKLATDTAVNGEEALERLKAGTYDLMLLDLRMPGMDGMEVLRRTREIRPELPVAILTAYGSVESAVEAMKLGAVDFIQKPFSPQEIRELVTQVLGRGELAEGDARDFASHLQLAKRFVGERAFAKATEQVHQAIALDATQPEAFNLLGALQEIAGDKAAAQKTYRMALALNPTYQPALINLMRMTGAREGEIVLDAAEAGRRGKG